MSILLNFIVEQNQSKSAFSVSHFLTNLSTKFCDVNVKLKLLQHINSLVFLLSILIRRVSLFSLISFDNVLRSDNTDLISSLFIYQCQLSNFDILERIRKYLDHRERKRNGKLTLESVKPNQSASKQTNKIPNLIKMIQVCRSTVLETIYSIEPLLNLNKWIKH